MKLIALGDSWFHYPKPVGNIIYYLKTIYKHDIGYEESFISTIAQGIRHHPASKDDTLGENGEDLMNMAFNTKVDHHGIAFTPTWLELLYGKLTTVTEDKIVILLSGGGNDIVGEEMRSFLNPKASGLPVLREQNLHDFIHNGLHKAYERITKFVRDNTAGKQVRFIIHGYAYPPVNGRSVTGMNHFIGPWLKPYLLEKGVVDRNEQDEIARKLIDTFNTMLEKFVSNNPDCYYIDLRKDIRQEDSEWCNELHLNKDNFVKVAGKFHNCIQNINWVNVAAQPALAQ